MAGGRGRLSPRPRATPPLLSPLVATPRRHDEREERPRPRDDAQGPRRLTLHLKHPRSPDPTGADSQPPRQAWSTSSPSSSSTPLHGKFGECRANSGSRFDRCRPNFESVLDAEPSLANLVRRPRNQMQKSSASTAAHAGGARSDAHIQAADEVRCGDSSSPLRRHQQ